MIRLVRGKTVVIGLTYADMADLFSGEPIEIKGELAAPGRRAFIIVGESDAEMERDLIAGVYSIPNYGTRSGNGEGMAGSDTY